MSSPITDLLDYHLRAGHTPGGLVHVERAGRTLAREVRGRIRPDDDAPLHEGVRYRIASLTKPMVTLAALMQVDEGRLDLDAPVGSLLPALRDMRLPDGRAPRSAPTVRDLMRHTSGLAYPTEIADAGVRQAWTDAGLAPGASGTDATRFLGRLATLPLVAEPGSAFRYGYSTDVLGCIVEQIDGVTLGAALRRRLFEPLGLRHTGFVLNPGEPEPMAHADDKAWHAMVPGIGRRAPGQPCMDAGGGGLLSTLDDVVAFGRCIAQGGVAGGRRLVSERAFAELSRNQLPAGVDGPAGYCGSGFGFGLGFAVRLDWGPSAMPCSAGELTWSGISGTALFVQPREQWVAVMLTANMSSRLMARFEFRRAAGRV
ncbi:MAG: serine hydrolase domain-containing protein [Rubrivivax sp.]